MQVRSSCDMPTADRAGSRPCRAVSWVDVLQAKTDDVRTTDQGALMHVLATTVEALVVVCGHGPASEKAALDHIIAVDPPSAKVQLKEVLTTMPCNVYVPAASNAGLHTAANRCE